MQMNLAQLLAAMDGTQHLAIKDYNTQRTLYDGMCNEVRGVDYGERVLAIYSTYYGKIIIEI